MKTTRTYKKLRRKSRFFRFLGFFFLAVSTLGAFLIYEFSIGWKNFEGNKEVFTVVNEETLKLNLAIALPIGVGFIVFLVVALRRNKELMKTNLSTGIIVVTFLLYLLYSVIEIAMFSLIGATVGSILDDFIFTPISRAYARRAEEQKEIDTEYYKEKRRIEARKQAEVELNGSV